MLQHALVNRVLHDAHVTLITLWDGKAGDAAGGIADLINRARNHGINVVPIPTKDILD